MSSETSKNKGYSRRGFLKLAGVVGLSVLLGGCGVNNKDTAPVTNDTPDVEQDIKPETNNSDYSFHRTEEGVGYSLSHFSDLPNSVKITDIPEDMVEFKCPDTIEGTPVMDIAFSSVENPDLSLQTIDVSGCSSLNKIDIYPERGSVVESAVERDRTVTLILGEKNSTMTRISIRDYGLGAITGLESCINLETLDIDRNKVEQLDISALKKLQTLIISNNPIKEIDVSQNVNLADIITSNGQTIIES
ncbi:MAG: twin-arginine translocation signal domain-containing protein [Coriobacteriales bacterium]|jgi:Leucine-rich repeat (LRR) protein|nr:twin-arginine translocation signal domain-containing protein [Coriobacteriales bacterium]